MWLSRIGARGNSLLDRSVAVPSGCPKLRATRAGHTQLARLRRIALTRFKITAGAVTFDNRLRYHANRHVAERMLRNCLILEHHEQHVCFFKCKIDDERQMKNKSLNIKS